MPEVEHSVDSRCELPTVVPTVRSRRWGGLCPKRLFAQMARTATLVESVVQTSAMMLKTKGDMRSQIRR